MADIATTPIPHAPHPSRPRTRDDTDPAVIKDRARRLESLRRERQANPDEFLRKKRLYNARHKVERAAYKRDVRAAKRAEREAASPTEASGAAPAAPAAPDTIVLINLLDLLKAMMTKA